MGKEEKSLGVAPSFKLEVGDDVMEEQLIGVVLRWNSGEVFGELLGDFNGETLRAHPWWSEEE